MRSLFNKVGGLQLYLKEIQHRCFPVNSAKLLVAEHLRWLLPTPRKQTKKGI